MGISNGRAHLERRIGTYLSELRDKRKVADSAMAAASELPALQNRITHLEELVRAIETLLREDDPTWNCSRVKPRRKNSFESPFPIGEAGPMALDVLREATLPMTIREVVLSMLERIDVTECERTTVDRVANSLGAYLRNHKSVLVDSDDAWPQKWWVIR